MAKQGLLCLPNRLGANQYHLDQVNNNTAFQAHIDSALKYLKQKQHMTNDASVNDGAIAGSFPIWGRYSMFEYPNWAAKFFADALIADATRKQTSIQKN